MTQSLRSLRYSAELEASGYARGAEQVASANDAMGASARAAATAVAETSQKIGRSGDAIAQLSRQFVSGYREAEKFDQNLRRLGTAVERDASQLDQAVKALAGMQTALGRTANATELLERGQIGAAKVVETLNRQMLEQSAAADRAASANARLAASNDNAIRKVDQLAGAQKRLAVANEAASHNTANLAAQFQDIAVTAAMGMSPMQIALQQGTQISAVLGPLGAAGAIRSLGAAFVSLVNPVSLVTIGLVAASAAAIQYFVSAKADARDINEVLSDHEAYIRSLKDAYGEAAKGLRAYIDESAQVEAFLRRVNATELLEGLRTSTREALDKVGDELDADLFGGARAFRENPAFAMFQKNITELSKAAVDGQPDILSFRQALVQLSKDQPSEGIDKMVRAMLSATDEAAKIQRAMPSAAEAISLVGGAASGSVVGVMSLADALSALGNQIPTIAAAQRAQAGVIKNQQILSQALNSLDKRMASDDRMTDGMYADQVARLTERYNQANDAVTGFTAAEEQLSKKERSAAIGAMDDRAAAAARIRDEYAALSETIARSASNGKSQADVDRQLERATNAMNVELAASARHFDELAAKAGERGAAREVRDAAKAAREARRDFQSFASDADRFVEQMFPGEAARRDAEELVELMGRFGDQLDSLQASAVNAEIQNLFKASELGVRRLGDKTESRMAKAATAVEDTLGGVLADLFSRPTRDLDAFVDDVISAFAQLGQQNLQKTFDGLFGGNVEGANVGRGASASSQAGALSGIGKIFSSLFGASMTKAPSFVTTQSRAVADAAAKVSTRPVTNVLGDLGSSIKKTATDLGVSAREIAAIIGYETGGTYNAWQKGPTSKWGEHRGLIQWGEPQRRQYGVTAQSTVAEQMEAVTRYLRNAGVQPGMGLKDLYSAVNAGRVGLYDRIDGATTVMQKVLNDIPKHYASADRLLGAAPDMQSAVADGTKTALTAVASARAGAGAGDGLNIVTGQQTGAAGASLGGAGLGGALNAALGGFGMGAQTENPAMGALGGALSGFSAGGLPGAIIGGIAGFVGGLFGKSRAKKKEQAQARNELNSNKTAIEAIFATGEGRGIGSATQAYNEFYDKTAEIDIVAQKAGDDELVQKLRNNVNKFFVILEKDFIGKFDGVIQAYSSGLGSNSAFLQGLSGMEQLREELKDFVADAQTFGDLQLKHNRDLTPEQLARRVAEAQVAAQQMVLKTIAGVEALSEMETAMQHLRGSAVGAQSTLEQLGMSAEAAAASIAAAMDIATAKLRDGFMKDITSSLNQLSGVGYLNDILDAQVAYAERMKDSAALGVDGSYALRELSLSLKEIVTSAGLTKDEVAVLSAAFPQVQLALQGWTDEATMLSQASSDLQAAYDKEASAINDVISRTKTMISSLKDFRDAMRINDSSPLGPKERVDEAAKQFRDVAALAATGDEAAMGKLTSVSQEYLDEARSYYASSVDYFKIWEEVDRTLERTQATGEFNLSAAEKQLSALDASVNGILDINKSVLSVKDALDAYAVAQVGTIDALKEQIGMIGTNAISEAYHKTIGRDVEADGLSYWQSQIAAGKSIDWISQAIGNSPEAKIQALYRQIFGRDADQASLDYWLRSGKTMDQISADLSYAKSVGGMARGGIVGGYVRGGMVGNGLYNVDSVRARYAGGGDIALAGGEYVTRATSVTPRTAPTLDHINRTGQLPGNDNSAVAAELRALREETRKLREQIAVMTKGLGDGMGQQIALARESNQIQQEMAAPLRRVASKL